MWMKLNNDALCSGMKRFQEKWTEKWREGKRWRMKVTEQRRRGRKSEEETMQNANMLFYSRKNKTCTMNNALVWMPYDICAEESCPIKIFLEKCFQISED